MIILGHILCTLGLLLIAIAVLGVLRFPDFYTRLHAIGVADTLGISSVLMGLCCYKDFDLDSIKILLIAVFIFFANPLLTFILARSAKKSGLKHWSKDGDRQAFFLREKVPVPDNTKNHVGEKQT